MYKESDILKALNTASELLKNAVETAKETYGNKIPTSILDAIDECNYYTYLI